MAMSPQLWNLSAAAGELRMDRRRLADCLAGIAPEGQRSGRDGWLMATIVAAVNGSRGELDLTQERARLANLQADAQEMKNAVSSGHLLLRADVDAAVIAAYSRVRARLLGIPAKLAPIVVSVENASEAQAHILDAIKEALHELSESTVDSMCGDDGELVADTGAAAGSDGQRVGG